MTASLVTPGIEDTMKDLNETNRIVGSLMATICKLNFPLNYIIKLTLSHIFLDTQLVRSSWVRSLRCLVVILLSFCLAGSSMHGCLAVG